MSTDAFLSIHVTGGDWRTLCDRALDKIGPSFPGRLAFIYVAAELAGQSDRIVDYLRERSGITHWAGCVGIGLCSNGLESYEEAGLAILATPFSDQMFRLFQVGDGDDDSWLTATRDWRDRELASVAIVHASPTDTELPERLQQTGEALGGGFLIGGIASAEDMAVQIADRALGDGLSGVLFSGRVALSTGLSQGCSLIAQRHTITRCERHIVQTIDDRPALDVLKDDLGPELAGDLQSLGGLIFAALPVAGSDTGDYLVRNLLGFDPDNGLIAIGDHLSEGDEIQFARRDRQTARADLERMVRNLTDRLPGPPRGGLYHTCLGRGRHLFGGEHAEMRLIQNLLGDVPLAGFYANGEISHNRLYGYTGVLTLFS